MLPSLLPHGPNKAGLLRRALYLVGGCHLEDGATDRLRARPYSAACSNDPRQGINGNPGGPRRGPRSADPCAPGPAGSPAPGLHMRQARGCGRNAGRALPTAGREHAGRVAHSRVSSRQGGEEETVPSPGRALAAAAPALLISGIFRMPRRAAGWEGTRGEGGGSGGHALGTGGATRKARSRRSSHRPPGEGNQRDVMGTAARRSRPAGQPQRGPTPRPTRRSRPRHLTWVAFPHRL